MSEFCSCGSGLRTLRCCGLDPQALPGEAAAALLDPQGNEATRLFNERKYEQAEALALNVLDAAPNNRLALRVLHEIRKAQKRGPAAEALGARLAGLPGPGAVRAQANGQFVQYLVAQGRHGEALPFAAAAVKAAPKDANAHHVMAVTLTETNDLLAGERHYRRALQLLGQEDGLVLANLAWNLKLQGRLDEAAALYQRALALRADNRRALGGAAQVEFARGNRDNALKLLDDALAGGDEDRSLRLLRAMGDVHGGAPAAALERLGAPEPLLAPELLLRGQALERLGRHAEALAHFAMARRLQRERGGQVFDPAPLEARLAGHKAYFTGERTQPLPRAGGAPVQPVFLLGFARAGTGLLEQMLAQVPGIVAGDEAYPAAALAGEVTRFAGGAANYPEALDELLVGDGALIPDQLRALYLARRARRGLLRGEAKFITDRGGETVWHLGLVKLLFPEAPVIHVLRHPYDLMLSNLAQDRKLEANAQVGLPALARYFELWSEMLRHYRAQLTLRYLPVRYEELVADPRGQLARVAAFIGAAGELPDEAVLRANEARLPDPRPAHAALRAPLHGRGVGRYKAYQRVAPDLFTEIRDRLTPWLAEQGYEEGFDV
ncbi:sulfotransferase [Acidocella sp.]|uniref:tetratricopeptide repeat-containing sulfotransferase family protein n=1 Tax=Acidocella sp. TaxID=50710 RepID=UPI00261A1BB0|nr:sulfotransferase [Acidocella sp.]